jgi:hypothetical protein
LAQPQSPDPLSLFSSTSFHGPHSPMHLQQVLLVHASGVRGTTNRLASFRMRPTPMVGAFPLLHAIPGFPATRPHEPYAIAALFLRWNSQPPVFKKTERTKLSLENEFFASFGGSRATS